MKIICETLFDCSATGITGHFRQSQVPFEDRTGTTITDILDWNRSRNQQRNFETLLQVISLRSTPEDIQDPVCDNGVWRFEFTVMADGAFAVQGLDDPFAALYQDCEGVPMIVNLRETHAQAAELITKNEKQNIWFRAINTSTENGHG